MLDYAGARRGLSALLLGLRRELPPTTHLRILLLARGTSDWWSVLKESDDEVDLLVTTTSPRMVPTVPELDRPAEFIRAYHALASHHDGPAEPRLPDLKDPRFARPFYLHVAALMTGKGQLYKRH